MFENHEVLQAELDVDSFSNLIARPLPELPRQLVAASMKLKVLSRLNPLLQISHRNRFVARSDFGDRTITNAAGSGIPGRFRFFFATATASIISISTPGEQDAATAAVGGLFSTDTIGKSDYLENFRGLSSLSFT